MSFRTIISKLFVSPHTKVSGTWSSMAGLPSPLAGIGAASVNGLPHLYVELKNKYPDAIILFKVNDFYEVFADDAKVVSDVLNTVLTKSKSGYFLTGFPDHNFDTYLRKLINAGYKLAVYDPAGISGISGIGAASEFAELGRIRTNIMGTTSFDLKIPGMRKMQDFTVYPISKTDSAATITIQSDTRIGQISMATGKGVMSKSHSSGAYFVHLNMDPLQKFQLSPIDLQTLKMYIFTTADDKAGKAGVITDNSGTLKLF